MSAFENLKDKLREIFQLDRNDLDFGLYRIMNLKSEEVSKFIEEDLLPQVKNGLASYAAEDSVAIKEELDKTVASLRAAGLPEEQINATPKVVELNEKLKDAFSPEKVENEIYSDLYNFFKRYYSDGDFMSLRRYKEGVYALPYEGEEVKLHWANADQYYIKSSETLSNYTFKIEGKKIRFEVVDATTEQNNNKDDKNRRFRLYKGTEEELKNPVSVKNNEFVVAFTYLATEGNALTQKNINEEIFDELLANPLLANIAEALKRTTSDASRLPILQKHINNFTAKNTFDYFIHKDLRGFLNRELDFFIKNEIMHLDDIENESAAKVEQYLGKIKVLRTVAHKIIDFLASIENFQKKLWLKKKFVLETNYCITLDRVPEELYSEIVKNKAQHDEWIKLFAIDEIAGEELGNVPYSNPLKVEFLKANPFLVLDTQFFSTEFKYKLLASIDNLDENTNGLLIHSENFQALELIQEKYLERISSVYIDPPYNTGTENAFMYKDNFQHSSWISFIYNRTRIAHGLLNKIGSIFVSTDDGESANIKYLLSQIFNENNFVNDIIWNSRKSVSSDALISESINHTTFFNKDKALLTENKFEFRIKYFSNSFSNPDNDPKGEWTLDPLDAPNIRENLSYPIKNPETLETFFPPEGRHWRYTESELIKYLQEGRIVFGRSGNARPQYKRYLSEAMEKGMTVTTLWDDVGTNTDATKQLLHMFRGILEKKFIDKIKPKPTKLVERIFDLSVKKENGISIDYFAGSGTTGHAVINLNRQDEGNRKYILCEMGEYFDALTKPRISKGIYSEDWKDGKPKSRKGSSHMFKYIRLESYEDCLDNLKFDRAQNQTDWLENNPSAREEYMIKYMMDLETKDSILDIKKFETPFDYKINVTRDGEIKQVNLDLVETFNFLIGLNVDHIEMLRNVLVVEGITRAGEKTLVLWRNVNEVDSNALDDWFRKCKYSTADSEFDIIYVNGDNNLENLRRDDQTWKVRLTEAEFPKRMFDVQDVK